MASQADRDTARAKSRQGGGQTASDTARAQARTQADTARAKSRQNGGDGGTSERMSQREAAAGLNLAGNNTMSGRGGSSASPVGEASGANVSQDSTIARPTSGDPFYTFDREIPSEEVMDQGVHDETGGELLNATGAFNVIICRNGVPHTASINGTIGGPLT